MSLAFEEEPDCVDVEAVAQALAKAFDRAVVVAIAKTIALVVGDNCVEGSGANAIASAEGVAKRFAQAFAFAIAKASNQNAGAIAEAEATGIEVSAVCHRVFVAGLVTMHSLISL